MKKFGIRDVCKATDMTRTQLEQWITRGHVQLEDLGDAGVARDFTLAEIRMISTMVRLTRLGLPLQTASRMARYVTTFTDGRVILAIWQGPIALIPTSPRGTPATIRGTGQKIYSSTTPELFYHQDIIDPHELPAVIQDPDVHSLIAVNLDHVENQILRELGLTREDLA